MLKGTQFYKACLEIKDPIGHTFDSSDELLQDVMDYLYSHMRRCAACEMDYEQFCSHSKYSTYDQSISGRTSSYEDDSGNFEWAMEIRAQDPEHTRRAWRIHVGLRYVRSASSIKLYYQEFYVDYLAGLLSRMPSPSKCTPTLIYDLQNEYDCFLGGQRIVAEPSLITPDSVDSLFAAIDDEERVLPVVLLTCPGTVNPNYLQEMTLGNILVYYVDELFPLELIDVRLPSGKYVQPGSICIFLPYSEGSLPQRTIMEADILRHGIQTTVDLLRQAFCEGLRNREKREYLTYNDLCHRYMSGKIETLEKRLNQLRKENSDLQNAYQTQRDEVAKMGAALEASNALLDRDLATELEQYEETLSDSMHRLDAIGGQISTITSALFDRTAEKPMLAELPISVEIAHLLEAIRYRIHADHLRTGESFESLMAGQLA